MSNNYDNMLPVEKRATTKQKAMTSAQRKMRKLKRNPRLFLVDSKVYAGARKTVHMTRSNVGSFTLALLGLLLVVVYYGLIASPRYVSQVQFVIKQVANNDKQLAGIMNFATSSPSMRDALILQEYILSQEMALTLDKKLGLKAHYQNKQWDLISRLRADSSKEEYIEYYQKHIHVRYDDMSEILLVEVQSFDAQYSLKVAEHLLVISENLINSLGKKISEKQMDYANYEVERAYNELKQQQLKLIDFQDKNSLYNPELQSKSLFAVINKIEAELIVKKAELKSMQAYLRSDASEIKTLGYKISALEEQLKEERSRLTNQNQKSLNKVNIDFKELQLNVVFATDLYNSALASLEMTRTEAFNNLKHLIVVVPPRLAEKQKYPQRLYSIFTWFVVITLIYFVSRLVLSIVKEHKE